MMKIVGIGSCLSEQVARHFGLNQWGHPISMVRHNRSDQLVHIMNGRKPYTLEALKQILAAFPGTDPTNQEFVFGQSQEGIGRSTNEENIDLLTAMTRKDVGIVFVDNFMDLTADLWKTEEGLTFFSRFPKNVALERVARLPPSEAAKNYREIVIRCHEIWPSARVVFMHFPFSNYPKDSSRPAWGEKFAEELSLPTTSIVIPPWDVPVELLKNGQPHHYHHSVYNEIATDVHSLIESQQQSGV